MTETVWLAMNVYKVVLRYECNACAYTTFVIIVAIGRLVGRCGFLLMICFLDG